MSAAKAVQFSRYASIGFGLIAELPSSLVSVSGLALTTRFVTGTWISCYDQPVTGWTACYAAVSTSWTACYAAPATAWSLISVR